MSQDTIGRGVILLEANASGLNAAIGEARRSIKDLGDKSAQSSARASAGIDRHVRSLETQVALQGKSSREAELYRLAIRGASDEQLRAANSALKLAEAHQRGEEIGNRARAGVAKFGADLARFAVVAGTAAVGMGYAFEAVVGKAADFQDLAEKTGDTAENLASLEVAARTGGSSIDEVAGFAIRLSKGLTGVDDESSKAGAALARIGIDLKTFKQLGAADQLEAVAKALAKFDDKGGGKTAVLEGIAKGGAQLLPFFRELANEGSRQVILTNQQIQTADAYKDAQAKVRAEISLHAQAIAVRMIPAIQDFTGALADNIKELDKAAGASDKLGKSDAVGQWADEAAIKVAYLADAARLVGRAFEYVGETIAASAAIASRAGGAFDAAKLMFSGNPGDAMKAADRERAAIAAIVEAARERGRAIGDFQSFAGAVQARIAGRKTANDPANYSNEGRGSPAGSRPTLTFDGADKKDKGAEKAKREAERITETNKRLKESIEDYIGAQQAEIANQGPLSAARRQHAETLKQIEKASIPESDKLERRADAGRARDVAELNEALTAQRKANEELIASRAREEESARAETAQIREGNTAVSEQIALLGASLQMQAAIEKARIQAIITAKEQRLIDIGGAEAIGIAADALRDQIALLRQRQGLIGKSASDQADPFARAAGSIKRYQEEAADLGKQVDDLITNSLHGAEDALVKFTMTGKLSFRDLATSVITDIARIQARQAVSSAAGGIFSFLAPIISGAVGGFSTGASVAGANAMGGDVLGNFINLRGAKLATGTNFVPSDNFPALLHRGEAVVPAKYNPAAGGGSDKPPIIINQTTGRVDEVTTQRMDDGQVAYVLREAVIRSRKDRAGALADPNSSDSRAMRRNFAVQRER